MGIREKTRACLPVIAGAVAAIVVAGCSDETPVKFYICNQAHENCSVTASFKHMDSCKNYEKWAGMYCDSVSEPGKMICRVQPDHEAFATSYCSR